jgi:two-component system OmpR family response regulator
MQPSTSTLRVLIVDDEPMMRELISTRLSLAGYQTVEACDGYEGLDKLRDQNIGVMVLDLDMPRLDGFGVLREMKRMGHLERTPAMILTASHQVDDVKRAIKAGARDYLTKPFDDRLLLARVSRLARMASQPCRDIPQVVRRAPSQQFW